MFCGYGFFVGIVVGFGCGVVVVVVELVVFEVVDLGYEVLGVID